MKRRVLEALTRFIVSNTAAARSNAGRFAFGGTAWRDARNVVSFGMTAKNSRSATSGRFVLGRSAFAKISAVEGIRFSAIQEASFGMFEKKGLSASERRRALKAKHAPKG